MENEWRTFERPPFHKYVPKIFFDACVQRCMRKSGSHDAVFESGFLSACIGHCMILYVYSWFIQLTHRPGSVLVHVGVVICLYCLINLLWCT